MIDKSIWSIWMRCKPQLNTPKLHWCGYLNIIFNLCVCVWGDMVTFFVIYLILHRFTYFCIKLAKVNYDKVNDMMYNLKRKEYFKPSPQMQYYTLPAPQRLFI
jgi:hypothetical protein